MIKKCVIVIPSHKNDLSFDEEKSLTQLKNILGSYDVVLVGPNSLKDEKYRKLYGDNLIVWKIDNKWFDTYKSYCTMCNSTFFYQHFKDLGYEYMLIYQLDAWVLNKDMITLERRFLSMDLWKTTNMLVMAGFHYVSSTQ